MNIFNFAKEGFIVTILTLIVSFGISFIPLRNEFVKPIRQGFLDFDIYDFYYASKHLRDQKYDSNIVIVELETGRDLIADQISLLEKYKPTVIGIDATFVGIADKDTVASNELVKTINRYKNIVYGTRCMGENRDKQPVFIANFFEEKDKQFSTGFLNVEGGDFSVVRVYRPFIKTKDTLYPAFTSAIAQRFSPGKFDLLKKRDKETEIINYGRNIDYKGSTIGYTCITKDQLEYYDKTGQLVDKLTGKIVLLGGFVKKEPLIIKDFHFTPLNERVAGKSFPDMYGVVIHANILSMIMEQNYATQASKFVSWLLAAIIIFLFLLFIIYKHQKKMSPNHGLFLLIQFFLLLFVPYLFLEIYIWFRIKVNLLPIIISIVLCRELLGKYKRIALWLNKKYYYNTVFKHKEII